MGQRANASLPALHVAVAAYQFLLLPLFLLPQSPIWGLTLLPLVGLNNPLWSLIHETIHGSLSRKVKVNRLAGRLLGVCYAAPWRIVRTGHLLHHRFNRTPLDREEVFDPDRVSRLGAMAGYYFHLFGGLYLIQFLGMIAFLFPQPLLQAAGRQLLDPESYNGRAAAVLLRPDRVREIRVDALAIIGLLTASAVAYGPYAWMLALEQDDVRSDRPHV